MRLGKIVSVFILLFSVACVNADQTASPVTMLQTVTANTIDQISAYKKSHGNPQMIPFNDMYTIVNQQLLPHVDVDRMLSSVLARQCTYSATTHNCEPIDLATIDPKMWANLKQQYIYLLVGLYGSALSSADQYKITFNQGRQAMNMNPQAGALMEIYSQVQLPNSEPITLVYEMEYKNNLWLVYDISINGAISISINLRAQFSPTLQQQGLQGLLQVLTNHSQQMMNPGSGN